MHINTDNTSPDVIPTSDSDWNQLKDEIVNSFIPKNTTIESRPFEPEDFEEVLQNAKSCFEKLTVFSQVPPKALSTCSESHHECITSAIILCGEHSSPNEWTDDDCLAASQATLKTVMASCNCESLGDYISKTDFRGRSNCMNLMTYILPKLSKEEWKYYPSFSCCFAWLLSHVQLTDMKQVIQIALPISLNMMDDYTTPSKRIGLECLYHILTNISATELQWHIQLELLQNILKRFLYFRECELIYLVISCALEVAEKSQPTMKHTGISLEWSFYDEVLNVALPLMEFEQDIERRRIYGESLCLIVKSVSIRGVRWLPRILRIIEDYSKTEVTEKQSMMALNLCLRWSWPLISRHWRKINVIAGRVVFDSVNVEAVKEAELCICTLQHIVPKDASVLDVEAIRSRKK